MLIVLVIGSLWAVFFNDGDTDVEVATSGDGADSAVTATGAPGESDAGTADDPDESASAVGGDDAATPAADGSDATPAGDTASTTSIVLPEDPLQRVELEPIAEGLQQPTILVTPPGETRMFVAERFGQIRVIDDGGLVDNVWLNLTDRVLANGIEQGLLGMAFHPDYATNGRLFVYYTNKDGRRTLSEFWGGPEAGDPNAEKVLFSLPQPPDSGDIRHYAGMVQFGPDGYLYVSLGDGADARGQGQNPDSLYAAILRLDVDGGDPYAIPPDNPFVAGGGAEEVWAYGLRNPWRFSIDPVEQLLYVADVGQGDREEVSVVSITESGHNFGWANIEGTRCFFESGCDVNDYVVPIVEYGHDLENPDEGCSVTGGHVYRGPSMPELHGHYFFADWCNRWVKSVLYEDGAVIDEQRWLDDAGQVNGMGTDADGELYIVTFEGTVTKLVPVR